MSTFKVAGTSTRKQFSPFNYSGPNESIKCDFFYIDLDLDLIYLNLGSNKVILLQFRDKATNM